MNTIYGRCKVFLFENKTIQFLAHFFYALIIFHFSYNLIKLSSSNVDWILNQPEIDMYGQYIGWDFYRNAEWNWPITYFNNLLYPIGTVLPSIDCIPWLAIFFKFFTAFLPFKFQFFGIWTFLCLNLQGYFGFKTLQINGVNFIYSLLGSLLMMTSPSLILRFGHFSLMAHWILLYAFLINFQFEKDEIDYKKFVFKSALLTLFSIGIHPYFWAMLLIIFLCEVAIKKGLKDLVKYWVLIFICSLLMMWFLGFFWFSEPTASGFGFFHADLTSYINPQSSSRLFSSFGHANGDYEGYGYLGISGILLLITSVFISIKNRHIINKLIQNSQWAVIFIISFMFSLGSNINWRGQPIINFEFYSFLEPIPSIFRSSGRFIWIGQYIISIFTWIYIFQKKDRSKILIGIGIFFIVLPWMEIKQLIHAPTVQKSDYKKNELNLSKDNLVLLENWSRDFEVIWVYNKPGFVKQLLPFWMEWTKTHDKKIQIGLVSREPIIKTTEIMTKVMDEVISGNLKARSIYLIPRERSLQLEKKFHDIKCLNEVHYSVCRHL
jgi:hypothetical protein